MKKKIEWNDPCSYVIPDNRDNKLCFKGEYCFGGVNWHFSLNEQESGKYTLRGRMTAFPMDGNGSIRKSKLPRKDYVSDGTEVEKLSLANETEEKGETIGKALYLNPKSLGDNEKCLEEIRLLIEKAATDLFHENRRDLRRFMERTTYSPDKITPAIAFILHVDRFLRDKSRSNGNDWTEKTYDDYYDALLKIFGELNNKAMCQYDISTLQTCFARKKTKKQYCKLARDFWQTRAAQRAVLLCRCGAGFRPEKPAR